jgi:anti-sigma B factor antagonist
VKSDLADVGIVVEADSGAVARLIGEVACATAPRLREELIGLSDRGIRAVTVDPARLDFIDWTGLGVLVSAIKRFREHGGDLVLQSPKPAAKGVLEITGLTKVFAVS